MCVVCVHLSADSTVAKAGIATTQPCLYTVVSRADITSHTQYPFKSNILGKEEKIPIINDPLVTCGDELGVRTTIPGAFACPSLGC